MKPLRRVLVANRGEIAVRVIRAARDLGLESVAVFSDADEKSLHVKLADFSVHLPGNTPKETYLDIDKIIAAVKKSGADSVHPGYGFLSENAAFAESVAKAGAVFVGPSPKAMHLMGDKVEAKRLMRKIGVPCVPGSEGPLESADALLKCIKEIGLPVILKAAAGGGGRGMRIVRRPEEAADAIAACQREALSYFGNPQVFCERYLENPRHIEVQVLFDAHGSGVYLFERDCSIQRRHQKLIEEAPSTFLNAEQRERIGSYAVKAASAAGYCNAGTIEFICESPEKIYFMEMNTRIQVEHPVTEEITGVDLVRQQLLVAMGEKLPFSQKDLKIRGWAMEVRINAEDPAMGFLPGPGKVHHLKLPGGPGVRVDTHLYPGYEIPPYYDSMVAKLIVTGANREEVVQRLKRALAEFEIGGVPTTAKFHEAVLSHPDFLQGKFFTGFVEAHEKELNKPAALSTSDSEMAALLAAWQAQQKTGAAATASTHTQVTPASRWRERARWEDLR